MSALLVVEDVSLRLWRGDRSVQVLDTISMDLGPGEFGGVWADRSAGKTTLAKVISGVVRPDEGRVTLDGVEIVGASRREARAAIHCQIGLASRKGPAMCDLPVRAWIAQSLLMGLGWNAATHEAVLALERVGATGIGGQPWSRLSDSERTLVAIAYAIAREPRLLIVDDLVAGLGALRRNRVLALLHDLVATGVTVLMTSAELSDFNGADRIWSLADGRLNASLPRRAGEVLRLRPTGTTPPR